MSEYNEIYKSQLMLRKIQTFVGENSYLEPCSSDDPFGGVKLTLKDHIVYYSPTDRQFSIVPYHEKRMTRRFDYWEDVVRHLHYILSYPFAEDKHMRWEKPRMRGERLSKLYSPKMVKSLQMG